MTSSRGSITTFSDGRVSSYERPTVVSWKPAGSTVTGTVAKKVELWSVLT